MSASFTDQDLDWIKKTIESATAPVAPEEAAAPHSLAVPPGLWLPEHSGLLSHEIILWYMEKVSRLGRSFAKFKTHYWIRSDQGKLIVETMGSRFSPHLNHHQEIPLWPILWLIDPQNVRRIYISDLPSPHDRFNELELVSRQNLYALKSGKIERQNIRRAVEEIEIQLQLKASLADKRHIPIEDTATFQYFNEWKANRTGGAA